jgi:hypothetical protein
MQLTITDKNVMGIGKDSGLGIGSDPGGINYSLIREEEYARFQELGTMATGSP